MKKVSVFENENISTEMARTICEDLQKNKIEMLSFRNCKFTDKDFKRIVKAVGACTSLALRHFGLNINIICDNFRVKNLARAIERNASLVGLHLHGNTISDTDFTTICHHLKRHPRILALDIGDCNIGDEGMELICSLIKESKDMNGLHNLVLSHNPNITSNGWTKFGMALASGSCLRTLEIDYNDIGDTVATCIAIALPGAKQLETIDLECTCITDKTGQVLLHLIKTYNLKLKEINLKKTQVLESTKEAIKIQICELHTGKKNKDTSEDESSLAMSEPPLSDLGETGLGTEDFVLKSKSYIDTSGNITHTESFVTGGGPIVEVSPANKQSTSNVDEERIEEITTNERVHNLINFETDTSKINAAGFEIKEAFHLHDITDCDQQTNNEAIGNEINNLGEYETYVPEEEIVKHRDSICTMIESMEHMGDIENDVGRQSDSSYSVRGFQETDDTSKSANPSPLFYTRPMSAPMSGNDTLNVESGLLQAKLNNANDNPKPKDLASIIRQKKVKTNIDEEMTNKPSTSDIEVQDIK